MCGPNKEQQLSSIWHFHDISHHINSQLIHLQNMIIKTSAFPATSSSSSSSSSSSNSTSSNSGVSRMVALQQGEAVLDIQFQSQLLPDTDADGDELSAHRGTRPSHSTQMGAKSAPHRQDQPLGIGVLTTHRVLVFVVQDPSSSPLIVTNSHTHSVCSGAETAQDKGYHTLLHRALILPLALALLTSPLALDFTNTTPMLSC
jgi:hypothetical protein